jgi:hypothetical protein
LFLRCGAVFGVVTLLLASCLISARADDRASIFTVTVPVDATAANANAARDAARRDGARHAYDVLLQRLTMPSDRGRLPRATDAMLNDLVQGFEVANEHTSGVRYLADYSFSFHPDPIRRLLRQAGVPYAETRSKPVVVLAVLQEDGRTLLWETPNPWRDAWAALPPQAGLVPLILPPGDAADTGAIDAAAALAGDDTRLQALSAHYGGADVLVIRATLKSAGAHVLDVASTRYTPGSPASQEHWIGSYAANAGDRDADLMARAADGIDMQVEEAWKSANILNYGQSGTLTVTVPISGLEGWVAVRQRLAGVPAIEKTEIQSLDQQGAHLVIHFYGDPAQLRLALAQRNLELGGSDPDWTLALHAAAAQP